MSKRIRLIILLALITNLVEAKDDKFLHRASEVINQYLIDCKSERWKLWQESLCGPIIVTNRDRSAVSSHLIPSFERIGAFYHGVLPKHIPLANTAINWHNEQRILVLYPLPMNVLDRERLLAHEAFHRIQKSLLLSAKETQNEHLETLLGRYWLLLELRALHSAVNENNLTALFDAWYYREQRYQAFPTAFKEEQQAEINEGLAEYTGVKAVNNQHFTNIWSQQLMSAASQVNITRQFAYFTLPAWLLALEQLNVSWQTDISNQFNVYDFFKQNFELSLTNHKPNEGKYGALKLLQNLRQQEQDRQAQRNILLSNYQESAIQVPLINMSMSFDPSGTVALGEYGTHYKPLKVSDKWGDLDSLQGGLIGKHYQLLSIHCNGSDVIFDESTIQCPGNWRIDLRDGWTYDDTSKKVKKMMLNH